jgi:hypothetical protein
MTTKKDLLGEAAEKLQDDLDLGWTVVVALESDDSRDIIAQIVTGDPDDVEKALMLANSLETTAGMLRAYAGRP